MNSLIQKITSLEELKAWCSQCGYSISVSFPTLSGPTEENFWQHREWLRTYHGLYTVPNFNCNWLITDQTRHHYLHVSQEDPQQVAYTPNEEYGRADRQIRCRPGKYLTKFFSDHFSAEEIAQMASYFRNMQSPPELCFATTENEIEQVYLNGPSSCMSKDLSCYESSFHPVRVYSYPGTAVAYIKRGDNIVARVLVNTETKHFGRIYGDLPTLERLLNEAGYDKGCMCGTKLQKIIEDGRLVAPYIDYHGYLNDCGDHVEISDDGEYSAQETEGYAVENDIEYCDNCGGSMNPDDAYRVVGFESGVCSHCVRNDEDIVFGIYDSCGSKEYMHIGGCEYIDCLDEWVHAHVDKNALGVVWSGSLGEYLPASKAVDGSGDGDYYYADDVDSDWVLCGGRLYHPDYAPDDAGAVALGVLAQALTYMDVGHKRFQNLGNVPEEALPTISNLL